MLDCRTCQHQAHSWVFRGFMCDTHLDSVFDGFTVASPIGKGILVSTIPKSLPRLSPTPQLLALSCIYPSRRIGMLLILIWLVRCIVVINVLIMHHDPHSSTRVLIYIHHLPYQNSTGRYLDCRHNNSGHPQTTCTSTPDSTTFTPHLHFFFYFSSSSHPSSPQTPCQLPPLSRENRLYTSIPFSQRVRACELTATGKVI